MDDQPTPFTESDAMECAMSAGAVGSELAEFGATGTVSVLALLEAELLVDATDDEADAGTLTDFAVGYDLCRLSDFLADALVESA